MFVSCTKCCMYVFNVVINLLDLHGTLSMFTHTVSNLGFEGTATFSSHLHDLVRVESGRRGQKK